MKCHGCMHQGQNLKLNEDDINEDADKKVALDEENVKCPIENCSWTGLYKQMVDHCTGTHSKLVQCPYGCQFETEQYNLFAHVNSIDGDCPNRTCPFGCASNATTDHMNKALYYHLHCVEQDDKKFAGRLSSEKGFSVVNDPEFDKHVLKMDLLSKQVNIHTNKARAEKRAVESMLENMENQEKMLANGSNKVEHDDINKSQLIFINKD